MTDADTAEPELIAMVRRTCGSRRPILRSTAILHDLGIDGDDADELLVMISARFGTSFQGIDWQAYFHNETEWHLPYWLGFRDYKRRKLTVAHLLAVIERRAWFEPNPSN